MSDARPDTAAESPRPAGPDEIVCRLSDVSLRGRSKPRLDRVTLDVPAGFTAVLGWSGAGKTSLLNAIAGFELPDSGTIRVEAMEPGRLPFFWVPPDDGLWPHLSVEQHLSYVLPRAAEASGTPIDALLGTFDLDGLRGSRPAKLSQGERARLSVCRALATNASLLVMDEPLVHLDPGRVGRYRDALVEQCRRQRSSLLFATHSPEMALTCADYAICLEGGVLTFSGPMRTLYESPPTRELALLLGPMNWIGPDDARDWLGMTETTHRCWRPEQIDVVACDEPMAHRVESSRSAGAVTETVLVHGTTRENRLWVHRTPHRPLRSGECAALRRTGFQPVVGK